MNCYIVIRRKRISVNLPAGTSWLFYSSGDVVNFLWGKDVENYLIIKNGDAVSLSNGNLSEIEEYLEYFIPDDM